MNAPPSVSPPPLQEHLAAWERCLRDDYDKDFILDGIKQGFSLIDKNASIDLPKWEIIYPLAPHIFSLLSAKPSLTEELLSGGYITCPDSDKPKIVSALSAVPMPDGGIRPIYYLSRPTGQSVNTYVPKDYCKYEYIQDALSIIQPGWFMAIVDLKSAYQSVNIRPMDHAITGLQWKFHNDSDPIVHPSPGTLFTQKWHYVVVYLDDFFVCGPDFDSCKSTFDALIMTLRGLGFQINWNKIIDPTHQLVVFLGVQIDTVTRQRNCATWWTY